MKINALNVCPTPATSVPARIFGFQHTLQSRYSFCFVLEQQSSFPEEKKGKRIAVETHSLVTPMTQQYADCGPPSVWVSRSRWQQHGQVPPAPFSSHRVARRKSECVLVICLTTHLNCKSTNVRDFYYYCCLQQMSCGQ